MERAGNGMEFPGLKVPESIRTQMHERMQSRCGLKGREDRRKAMSIKIAIILLLMFSTCSVTQAEESARFRQRQKHVENKGSVTALAFHCDGKILAVGRYRTVILRDVGNGRVVTTLVGVEGLVTSLGFAEKGDLLAVGTGTAGRDGAVELWDWKAGHRIRILKGHSDLVYGIAMRPDGRQLAAVGYDRLVSLWNLEAVSKPAVKAIKPRYLRDHIDSVYGVAYSPNGRLAATAAADRTVKVWDTASGKRLFTLSESTGELYTVAFRPDGKQIAAGGADKTLRVWSVGSSGGTLVHSAFAHEGAILKVVYSHDGKEIYTSGEDNIVKQWNAESLDEKAVYPRQPDWPQSIAISPDGKLLAVGRYEGSLGLYNTESRKAIGTNRAPMYRGTRQPRQAEAFHWKARLS